MWEEKKSKPSPATVKSKRSVLRKEASKRRAEVAQNRQRVSLGDSLGLNLAEGPQRKPAKQRGEPKEEKGPKDTDESERRSSGFRLSSEIENSEKNRLKNSDRKIKRNMRYGGIPRSFKVSKKKRRSWLTDKEIAQRK